MAAEVKFEDFSIKVKGAINDAMLQFLEEAGGVIESAAKDNARVDSGETRRKWQHYVDESEGSVTIGNPLENAIWEEWGTGEYALEGKGRKGAWYIPVEKVTGKKKPTYNGKVVIVHGKNGQDFYKTNGKKPNRTLERAFNSKKAAIKSRAESIMKGLN